MDINLKITLTDTDLKDFCEALGWNKDSVLTKQQFFKKEIKVYVGSIIKSKRLRALEETQRIDLKNLADSTSTEIGNIIII
jgi:hypothetical protein